MDLCGVSRDWKETRNNCKEKFVKLENQFLQVLDLVSAALGHLNFG